MTVEYRQGDLFEQDVDVIAHGVNLAGSMSGGIAKIFRDKYPAMDKEYRHLCDEELLPLGSVFMYSLEGEKQKAVFNIATQVNPGKDAYLSAVEVGLINAVRECKYQGYKTLAIPEIGCGIGGLNIEDVKAILDKIDAMTDVQIIMVSL